MSRDQRVHDNHALLYAQAFAIEHKIPLVVVFNLFPRLGVRAREHFSFMLEGLKEVANELDTFNIPFVLSFGDMLAQIIELSTKLQPGLIVADFNPLRGVREVQKSLAKSLEVAVHVVDTHNIVPAWIISDKQEFAAHTMRRKLHKQLGSWLKEPETLKKHPFSYSSKLEAPDWQQAEALINSLDACGIQHGFTPGEKAAKNHASKFINDSLAHYSEQRNDPTSESQSSLSPYLHFGQISALRIVLDCMRATGHEPLLLHEPRMPRAAGNNPLHDGVDAFIEELVVRKELSDNFCLYSTSYDSLDGAPSTSYDSLDGAPAWAQKTLTEHQDDPREHLYTQQQFESAATHDDVWNAAQYQLLKTGKIHGYMRMYWAKKILEWSQSADEAIKTAVYLNDHYSIDGGDPNGYVGILWSIAGLHDRPWFNRSVYGTVRYIRSVYGTVRYMSSSGLEKKFDTAVYIARWS